MVRKIQLTWLPLLPWSSYASWRGPSLELSAYMWRVKKWCSGLITRMWKIVTNKEMSKHAVIFTGHSVHHVLDLYLEKAGLKKRIRHSCSDLSNLATLIFPPKLMGSEQANETKQCSKCSKIGPAWLKKNSNFFCFSRQLDQIDSCKQTKHADLYSAVVMHLTNSTYDYKRMFYCLV